MGIETGARVTVADDAALLESAFRTALSRADIVIATGGLGPTEDDLTREAAAAALGRPLHRVPALIEELKARFARFGRVMAPVNEKQADVIEGAVVLSNPRGTAPGQRVRCDRAPVVLLPGPAARDAAVFEERSCPRLRERARTRAAHPDHEDRGHGARATSSSRAPIYKAFTNPRTTIRGGPGRSSFT